MTNSIPASQLVNVTPSVIGTGGSPLSLNSVFLTHDTSIPIGTVKTFSTLADAQAWFGASAAESILAGNYFLGSTGASVLPGTLHFYQYNAADVAGYLRGGSLVAMTLAQLQALSGAITVVIDGVSHVSLSINLSSASSFSNAAALIQTGLQGGSPSTTATVTYDSLRHAFVITSATTGASSTLAFPTTTSFTTGLALTAAAGAVLSAGAIAATPTTAMNGVVSATQNWATFMTVFEPDTATKLLFAVWVNGVSAAGVERFLYIAWDTDVTPESGAAPNSFGAQVVAAAYNGVEPIWEQQAGAIAAFQAGAIASIDFTETNGRTAMAYRSQSGLSADVTNATIANNLTANGYNFYAAYATANDRFVNFQHGSVPGVWKWIDPYINQIWLNSQFQLALMSYLQSAKSTPYNQSGYNALRTALLDPIAAAVNFGAIRPGVTLSAAQAQQVNTAAGVRIDGTLSTVGWYLQIKDASPQVRGLRGSPPMKFWYMDGGNIQTVNLSSITVE